jgi:outer membrane protein assembly factor BamD (BamD/ComL family)
MVRNFFLCLGAALLLGACASGPDEIPENKSPAELIQLAQEASDHSQYNQALKYYETMRERYASDMEIICTAEYEIAFIHYKQKKYIQARSGFNALLARYEGPDGELLPPQFEILSEIVLKRMEIFSENGKS